VRVGIKADPLSVKHCESFEAVVQLSIIDSVAARGGVAMSDLIWLSEAQMRRIEPYFPLSHGVPRVDDRRIISGIIFVIRNG
jgi:hypothetical protein